MSVFERMLNTQAPMFIYVVAGIIMAKTPSVVVVFVGIALMFAPFRLPAVLSLAVKNISNMTGPLSMMLIGAALGESDLRGAFDSGAMIHTAVRLAVLPVIFLFLFRGLGVEAVLWQVAVTLTAMPAAANTEIFAEMSGKDYIFAARCVVLSTIISLFSVPLLTLLF